MNNLTTVVIAAAVFALVGTMVFAAVAPNISVVKAVDEHGHKGKCGHNPPCGNKFV